MYGGASQPLLFLNSSEKDNNWLGKKLILITCEKGEATTEYLEYLSLGLEKTSENNAMVFLSIFTFIAFIFFKLTRKNFAMEFEP